MNDKKHIDRLFQESFKDFEATPDDAVWKRIEAQLDKKKKRYVIPIWWRYGGVAASLLLLLTLGLTYFNTTENPVINTVVDSEKNTPVIQKLTEQKVDKDTKPQSEGLEKTLPKNSFQTEQPVVSNKDSKQLNLVQETEVSQGNLQNKSTQKAPKESILIAQPQQNKATKSDVMRSTNNVIAQADASKSGKENNNYGKNPPVAPQNKATPFLDDKSKKEFYALAENTAEDSVKKMDSTVVAKAKMDKELSIEAILNNSDTNTEEKIPLNKWRIAANAAPVYFNALGDGSTLDSQFDGNSKTGEVNMSYGITASYAINPKLRIRSGVNKVSLGYQTNNVVVYQALDTDVTTSSLQFVSQAPSTTSAFLLDNNPEQTKLISASNVVGSSPNILSSNAALNQSFGYIEIPLELEYALVNKRFGLRIIGGFSTLFLSDNAVYAETDSGSRTFLGEANNMNKTSYSGNFGLGFSYSVSKKLDFNIEPLMKYQINTFNNTAGDITPFFIGVYTGLAIKF